MQVEGIPTSSNANDSYIFYERKCQLKLIHRLHFPHLNYFWYTISFQMNILLFNARRLPSYGSHHVLYSYHDLPQLSNYVHNQS